LGFVGFEVIASDFEINSGDVILADMLFALDLGFGGDGDLGVY
jgi:hypothetical protein